MGVGCAAVLLFLFREGWKGALGLRSRRPSASIYNLRRLRAPGRSLAIQAARARRGLAGLRIPGAGGTLLCYNQVLRSQRAGGVCGTIGFRRRCPDRDLLRIDLHPLICKNTNSGSHACLTSIWPDPQMPFSAGFGVHANDPAHPWENWLVMELLVVVHHHGRGCDDPQRVFRSISPARCSIGRSDLGFLARGGPRMRDSIIRASISPTSRRYSSSS